MGDVVRALIYDRCSRIEDEIFFEPGPEILRQIGHSIPRIYALFVKPLHDLIGAKALVPCRFDLVFQAFESFAKETGFLGCKSHRVELARFAREWKFEVWNQKLENIKRHPYK